MRKLFKIIPFILIFCFLFSSVSFGAAGSGSTNKFANTFPLKADISYFNNSDCYPFYSFNTDLSSYISQAFDAFEDDTNITLRRDELCYFLVYGEYRDMYLIFWYKYNEPTIEMINTDFYTPRFYGGKNQKTNDGFGIGRVKINKASYNNYFEFDSYYVSGSVDCLTYYDHCLKFAPTQETNFKYLNNSLGFWCYGVPLVVNSTSIPFEFTDTNGVVHNLTFFEGNVLDNEDTSDSEVVLPDIPEDTDSNIITLIKAIGSFFSQLINKITSLFANLISKIKEFLSDLLGGISELFSNLQSFLSGILNNIVSGISNLFSKVSDIYNYLTDTNVDTDYFFESNFYHFVEQILNFRNMFIFSDVSVSDSVSFELDFTKSDSFLSSVGVVLISFDWYLPYRSVVSTLLLVFVYVGLAFRFFKELPSLISGNSGEESGS